VIGNAILVAKIATGEITEDIPDDKAGGLLGRQVLR
jgi:hypothetical protein